MADRYKDDPEFKSRVKKHVKKNYDKKKKERIKKIFGRYIENCEGCGKQLRFIKDKTDFEKITLGDKEVILCKICNDFVEWFKELGIDMHHYKILYILKNNSCY